MDGLRCGVSLGEVWTPGRGPGGGGVVRRRMVRMVLEVTGDGSVASGFSRTIVKEG